MTVTGAVIQKTGRDGFTLSSLTDPDFVLAFVKSAAPNQPIRDLNVVVPQHAFNEAHLSLMQDLLAAPGAPA